MAWTTPATWVATAALTAAQLNTHLRDNLNAIVSPPRFSVYGGGAGQSFGSASPTVASYTGGGEDYDSSGVVSGGVFTATAATAGMWLFTYGFSWSPNATGLRAVWLEHSLTTRRYAQTSDGSPSSGNSVDLVGSALIQVANAETVSVVGFQSSGGMLAANTSSTSVFQGRWLGP